MPSRPNRRLADLGQGRQDDALRRADALCTAVDAAVRAVWLRLLRALAAPPGRRPLFHSEVYARAAEVLRHLPRELVGAIEDRLRRLAWWGWRSAGGLVIEAVPKGRLDAEVRDLVLAPPSPEKVARIVFGPPAPGQPTWRERVESLTRLADPKQAALTVSTALALGRTPREAAKELLPLVQGSQASARRLARTEAMRVAHEAQMEAWDGLGDLLVGYQVHAQRDRHTRPWHAERDGTVYYRRPAAGQLGLDRMPRPPLESPDPRDRPPKAPRVAPNCRCFLTPVLRSDT